MRRRPSGPGPTRRRARAVLALGLLILGALCAPGCSDADDDATTCRTHEDCTADELCLFGRWVCAKACADDGDCAVWQTCDACASASCPVCDDCQAACVRR